MCYYSSCGSNIIVTAFARRAPKILLSIHITTPSPLFFLFLAYVNISMYTLRRRLRFSSFLFYVYLLVANFTLYIAVEHRKNTSAYNAPRISDTCSLPFSLFLSFIEEKDNICLASEIRFVILGRRLRRVRK